MTGSSFVHLHVHTEYSMLDGAAKIAPLLAEAQRLEMPAVAITDHGYMFGAAEFYDRATAMGITPIIGIEAYLAPGSRHDKKPVLWGERGQNGKVDKSRDVGGSGAYTHLTLLAENATGLRNLFTLSSLASFEGQYGKWPRMDRELLERYHEGIIATTGCLGGEVSTRLRLGQREQALQAAADFRDIFGKDNYFVEVMDHGIAEERQLRGDLLDVGRQLGLRAVATNDSHYVTADQATAHAALLCVQTGKTLDDPTRFAFQGEGYHLKSAQDMRAYWDTELPGAADATLMIAERVQPYTEVFSFVDRMPRVPVPQGKTELDLLREEVERYAAIRFPIGMPAAYRERAEFELLVIGQMGFPAYFLVVGDVVRWAKNNGVLVGPGRGSAAGSLIAYLLHITDLDPIEHGLLFERFLNPERVSPPDIDLDFDDRGRDRVLRYTIDKWGEHAVAQVVTFGTIKTKAAIKDAARVHFGQPGYSIADSIVKALPPAVSAVDVPLSGVFDKDHPRYPETAEVRSMAETNPQVATILNTARGLEGLIRQTGVHACAVILSSQPLLDVIPLWKRPQDGSIITGWNYPSCEALGLLKMDFLGVTTLTVIVDTLAAVKTNHGVTIDLELLPRDNEAAYHLLARGDTLGVFQLDGAAMRDLLRLMRPDNFEDISAVGALYRPGPMGAKSHTNYALRKNGQQEITPIHPELAEPLKDILDTTYGLIVYQEQVMAIAQKLAGYTLGQADLLRRAMGKKKKEILDKEFAGFEAGMVANGYSKDAVKTLWEILVPFADYAFNKSHSAAYGLVSYWTAYLKANYPAEFMAAQLTANSDKKDKSAVYLAECRRMGITVLPPDVNESDAAYTAVNGSIRFGLAAVRNVGDAAVESIIRTRRSGGRFRSFADFMQRCDLAVCKKGLIDSLIKAGAFDSLGHTRLGLTRVHEDAVDAVVAMKKKEAEGQFDLFGDEPETDDGVLAHLHLDTAEWPRKQLLTAEREMLGLYVSAHPLDGAEHVLRRHAPKPIAMIIDDAPQEGEVALAGVISSVEHRVNKNGRPWAIVVIEDLDASMEVLFFAQAWSLWHAELTPDAVVAIQGRVNWRDEKMAIYGNNVITLDISDADITTPTPQTETIVPLRLRADATQITSTSVIALREVLCRHRGETPVHVIVHGTRETYLDVADYPVTPCPELVRAVRDIPGMNVLP